MQTINLEQALDRLDGDLELFVELAGVFIEEEATLIQTLRDAVESKDAHRIERAAHALKGAVSNLSAERAYELSFALEKKGREEELGEVDSLFESLCNELEHVRVESQKLIEQNKTT